jgi:hypothetical protein
MSNEQWEEEQTMSNKQRGMSNGKRAESREQRAEFFQGKITGFHREVPAPYSLNREQRIPRGKFPVFIGKSPSPIPHSLTRKQGFSEEIYCLSGPKARKPGFSNPILAGFPSFGPFFG